MIQFLLLLQDETEKPQKDDFLVLLQVRKVLFLHSNLKHLHFRSLFLSCAHRKQMKIDALYFLEKPVYFSASRDASEVKTQNKSQLSITQLNSKHYKHQDFSCIQHRCRIYITSCKTVLSQTCLQSSCIRLPLPSLTLARPNCGSWDSRTDSVKGRGTLLHGTEQPAQLV